MRFFELEDNILAGAMQRDTPERLFVVTLMPGGESEIGYCE
jgi:hypothetical protein